MEELKIPVSIDGQDHTVIIHYFEQSEYGQMTVIKTEGYELCVDKDLRPFMGHLPEDWKEPIITKLREVLK